MSLLTAERIKLFSTRAPWWCTAIAIAASLGFTALFVGLSGEEVSMSVANTQVAASFGRTVILVLAVLAASTEFNWGTMRITFQAVPSRKPALLAKGVVVGAWSALVGLVVGFGAWLIGTLLAPDVDLALNSGADWRAVAGQAPLFLLTGLLGVGVGLLLRNTGFALAVVLVWTQLVEGLVLLIPGIGDDLYKWMPFFAAGQFTGSDFAMSAMKLGDLPMGPLGYGLYFAALCLALFAAGVLVTDRRDS
ncbi:hypothetical protein [Amycolatopsis anabasis]|uniref:hypothetical protein n=1 Tax=Amycolatopsis anabasis TaxID=1840409 RepID=UPI00131AAF87|nr:hypothetical protein [Amycolatopsis anabasis]